MESPCFIVIFVNESERIMGNTNAGLSHAGSQGGLDDDVDDLNDLDAFHAAVLCVPDEVKERGNILGLYHKSIVCHQIAYL